MFLAASLDLVKDSTINKANIDKSTIAPLMVLIRLGFSPQSALLLMSQPIIREYTSECGKSKDFVYAKTVIKTLTNKYFSDIHKDSTKDVGIIEGVEFLYSDLHKGLTADMNNTDDKDFQYRCLMLFSVLNKISSTIAAINAVSKFNSIKNAAGPESEDNYITAHKIDEYDNKVALSKIPNIIGRYRDWETDRKSTRLNSSHSAKSRMPSSA